MSFLIKFLLIIFVFSVGFLVLLSIKKGRLTVKYSLIWIFSVLFLILALLVPEILEKISGLLGFEIVSNMLFLFGILILFILVFSLSIIVSDQYKRIKTLTQELSILKKKVNDTKK